jgi:non-ribosomal peptide synthetase component F
MSADDLVYVTFTSGTTGVPKGVMVAARSVAAYLTALALRKAMTADDRASQFTELSFDPSLGEIYVPWSAGASLHVVPSVNQVSPARFIRERRLTIWGSTPAAIAWMLSTRSLQPGSLSGLRYSSFGGEPLPLASVVAWQAAAPNSVVDNLYGPTEATVDCAGQRVEPGATPIVTPGRGILAIGTPHPGTELAIFGPDRCPLPPGEVGELAIAGKQLAVEYLGAPELTAERFPTIGGKRWYLTGDLAMQDESGVFHHLGRADNQIKIHGHRVELEDIEAHMRAVIGVGEVAAVAWPIEDGVAQAIVGFVARSELPVNSIREALRKRLPSHMVPVAIQELASLPRTAAGKLDRRALLDRLDAGAAKGDARHVG